MFTTASIVPAKAVQKYTLPTEHVPMKEEFLPFTIRVVSNVRDLAKAVRIRHAAYMRHVPGFAQALNMPEEADSEQGVVVLLAES